MGIAETIMIYIIIGVAVATTMWVAQCHMRGIRALAALAMWVLLWPFFAPALLGTAV